MVRSRLQAPPYKSGLSAKNRPYPSELAELAAISNPARKRDRKTGLLYISSRRFPALFSEGQTGSPGFKTQTGECNAITARVILVVLILVGNRNELFQGEAV